MVHAGCFSGICGGGGGGAPIFVAQSWPNLAFLPVDTTHHWCFELLHFSRCFREKGGHLSGHLAQNPTAQRLVYFARPK
jgi:hypothetical protein